MPAYAVVQGLIKQMLSKPEELLKTLTIVLERHPAVVNSHDPRTGSSLLQMVTENCNVTQVLELLMRADCHVGLQQNFVGMSAMHLTLTITLTLTLTLILTLILTLTLTLTPSPRAPTSP